MHHWCKLSRVVMDYVDEYGLFRCPCSVGVYVVWVCMQCGCVCSVGVYVVWVCM